MQPPPAEATGVSEGPWDRGYRGALAQEWSPALGSLPQVESPHQSSVQAPARGQHMGSD